MSSNLGSSANSATVLLGNGDGSFAAPQTSPAYNQGAVGGDFIRGAMVTADFNGDGKMDLAVVGDYVSTDGLIVLLGERGRHVQGDGVKPRDQSGLRIDRNGGLQRRPHPRPGCQAILRPWGSNRFSGQRGWHVCNEQFSRTRTLPHAIVVGEFNGDGGLDLAFGHDAAVAVFLGKGDGAFNETPGGPITGSSLSLVAGDFNQDGKLIRMASWTWRVPIPKTIRSISLPVPEMAHSPKV